MCEVNSGRRALDRIICSSTNSHYTWSRMASLGKEYCHDSGAIHMIISMVPVYYCTGT